MLIPVARLDCPVCRSAGLVFAFESHSGADRCLCGRCGLVWIGPDPTAAARLDAAMTSPQHAYRSRTSEGRFPHPSTVIGTYAHTH
jgi:ribosomal protein S27AE